MMRMIQIPHAAHIPRLLLGLLLAFSLLALPACQPDAPENTTAQQAAVTADSNLTFRSDDRLQEHFEKHGDDVGCSTPEEYQAAANAVITNPEALHKTQKEDGDDAYFLESTGEFVVVSSRGYIRTYFITDRGYFNRQ